MSLQYDWTGICADLESLLKVEHIPVGIKLFASEAEMEAVPKLKRYRDGDYMPCQLVAQAMHLGFTVGFGPGDIKRENCAVLMGLEPTDEYWAAGKKFTGVWFATDEDSAAHQKATVPVKHHKGQSLVASPLRAKRFDPDACMMALSPAQLFMVAAGLQHTGYAPLHSQLVGESSCTVTWQKTIRTGEPGYAPPSFAEMRYAAMPQDKIVFSLTPKDLVRAVGGLKILHKNGLRYPVPPYGCQCDVAVGMNVSYASPKSAGK